MDIKIIKISYFFFLTYCYCWGHSYLFILWLTNSLHTRLIFSTFLQLQQRPHSVLCAHYQVYANQQSVSQKTNISVSVLLPLRRSSPLVLQIGLFVQEENILL